MSMKAPRPEAPLTTLDSIRNTRTLLLRECDWKVAPDSPLTDSKKTEWIAHRQALRDLPNSYTDDDEFSNVVFPTEPE